MLIIEWNPPEGTRRVYDVLVPEFSLLQQKSNFRVNFSQFFLCSDFAALNISPTELSRYQKHCTTSFLMWAMPRCTSLKAKILAFVLLAENMLFALIKVGFQFLGEELYCSIPEDADTLLYENKKQKKKTIYGPSISTMQSSHTSSKKELFICSTRTAITCK